MKQVNQVIETNDYSMFKTLKGNRNVNKLHVKRLKNSFEKVYLMSPIMVNKKFEIIDGQHRYEAAKELKLPIRFLIEPNYGLKEVQILNENMKNWKKEDYLHGYCDLGHPEYLKFREFMNEYNDFGLAACEAILTDKTSHAPAANDKNLISDTNKSGRFTIRFFQEGNLEIPDYKKSVENAEKILMIKPYFDGYNDTVFVRAMIGIFKIEHYSHSQFLKKLSFNGGALQKCRNITQYKLLVEDIYNFKSREKVSLRF